MSEKKYSKEFKLKVLKEHEEGASFYSLEHCIANANDYAASAKEFSCSYGQVYSWVSKYNKTGVDGPKDGRGRNKFGDELSEIEKLRAENRLLKAEKKRQQMGIDPLKNSKKSRKGNSEQNRTS